MTGLPGSLPPGTSPDGDPMAPCWACGEPAVLCPDGYCFDCCDAAGRNHADPLAEYQQASNEIRELCGEELTPDEVSRAIKEARHDPEPGATHQAFMNGLHAIAGALLDIAVCARCAAEGSCESGGFTYSHQYEEWTCTDMTACDDRVADNEEVRGSDRA